ncbi:MAG: SpoIIE family protein phosphatase [Clostridia bacterium]|nr:SpoIIE family protein phosphatase [Clostridia bacterium]
MDNKRDKGAFGEFLSGIAKRRGRDKEQGIVSVLCCAVGFLFSGCHLIFGAYPLGISFAASLNRGVWFALGGAVLGALLMGRDGIALALVTVLSVLLRVIISSQNKGRAMFSESLTLRVSSAAVSGLVLAIYEILLRSLSLTTLLFGAFMTLSPIVLVPLFACIHIKGVSLREVLLGGDTPLFGSGARGRRRPSLIALRISGGSFIFFISLSLSTYSIFGVDISLIFATVTAVLLAKRFGALYGAVGGFLASVGIAPLYSVSFMLFGVVAGALCPLSPLVALALGTGALALFSGYAGEVSGLLSVLPECLIGATLTYPLLKKLTAEPIADASLDIRRLANDMVGTMTMSYRSSLGAADDNIPSAIAELSSLAGDFFPSAAWMGSGEVSLLSSLMKDSRDYLLSLREIDEELTERVGGVFAEAGFTDAVVRVFGGEEKYLLAAAEDAGGEAISSPELKKKIEEATDLRFREPRFYRRGEMVLMELYQAPKYKLQYNTVSEAGGEGEVSGDSLAVISGAAQRRSFVISDGMGSGDVARAASQFCVKYFDAMLKTYARETTLVRLLNGMLRASSEECPVALDVLSVDLYSGRAGFLKAGAVCSFIRRGDSLFRIKSETMPIGVLKSAEAELVEAELADGDVLVLMSDGISGCFDDAPWLIEALHGDTASLESFAAGIAEGAKSNNSIKDDMSVIAVKILSA